MKKLKQKKHKNFAFTLAEVLVTLSKQIKTNKLCLESGNDCHTQLNKLPTYNLETESALISADGITYISSSGFGLYIDVNGINGPNKFGRDVFAFWLAPESTNRALQGTVIPWGSQLDSNYFGGKQNGNMTGRYWKDDNLCTKLNNKASDLYCTGRVLDEGKMNY